LLNLNNKKAFTLPEILVASGIMLMVLIGLFSSFVIFQSFWSTGATQIYIQANTRTAVKELVRQVRTGRQINLFDNGDRIQVILDPQRTPYLTTDDVTVEYYLASGILYYDPDITVDNNTEVIARNIEKVMSQDIFKVEGVLLTVILRARDQNDNDGYQGVDIATSVSLRNL